MDTEKIVVGGEAFSVLKDECEKVIDITKRLPEFVFKKSFAKYFAIDYGYVCDLNFSSFLRKLSDVYSDSCINYMNLDPIPEKIVSFKSSLNLSKEYLRTMLDINSDALLIIANVGVFWGSSLKWGIVCDRISWELAVIAVSDEIDVPVIGGFRRIDAPTLSSYMLSQYSIKDPSIAINFSKIFLANYTI